MQMGIGKVGKPGVIFKKKHRWTLELLTPQGPVPPSYVKVASRPSLEIDETEINFLNAVTWMPGKGKWQPINITYLDVVDKEMMNLYSWISSIYDFQDDVNLKQTENWAATCILNLYDGCGKSIERWILTSCFPTSVNFGELDYESSEVATIDMTLRFSGVKIKDMCNDTEPKPQCDGC